MSTIKIRFAITDEARAAYAARTGRLLAGKDVLSLNLDSLTEAERATVLAAFGVPYSEGHERDADVASYKLAAIPETPADWVSIAQGLAAARATEEAEYKERKAREAAEKAESVARIMDELERTPDNLLWSEVCRMQRWAADRLAPNQQERWQAIVTKARSLHAEWEAGAPAREAEQARIQAEKEAVAEAKRATAEAERQAWIAEHGSDFLKKAVGAGYDCQRRYVTERAGIEHPGGVVDFGDNADWKSRSCPSEEALDLALKLGGEVVWLTIPPHGKGEDTWDFEPCEAVVVRGFLGKYDIVYMSF